MNEIEKFLLDNGILSPYRKDAYFKRENVSISCIAGAVHVHVAGIESAKQLQEILQVAKCDLIAGDIWRDATVEDAVRVMRGDHVNCRFRDSSQDEWQDGELVGYVPAIGLSDDGWFCSADEHVCERYAFCQVSIWEGNIESE